MERLTLDKIVKELLNEFGEETAHKYNQLLNLGKTGLRELNQDISGSTKIKTYGMPGIDGVDFEINSDTITAPLPDDYISYKRIGVCINNVMIPLGYNPLMCMDKMYDDCGNPEVRHNRVGQDVFLEYPLHYRNGSELGAYFGMGGGGNAFGYYRIDQQFWQIQFGSVTSSYPIVMEYLADVDKIDGQFIIHPYLSETVKAFISWAYVRNRRGANANEILLKRKEYYNQRRLSTMRFTSFTLDEAYQYGRLSFKQSPKA